ncbi:WD40-repeat-containing domain protein [Cunninghamella echinulata]|nr:WD40-repeat-containing domain protein [Cunninghamella echinulata]
MNEASETEQEFKNTLASLLETNPELNNIITRWNNEQKVEFAYFLLQSIPNTQIELITDRLLKLHTRNLIDVLPQELVVNILCYLDLKSILELSVVSQYWYTMCQVPIIWKCLFEAEGWEYDLRAIEQYLAKDSPTSYTIPSKKFLTPTFKILQSTPIVRSTMPLYHKSIHITKSNNNNNNDNNINNNNNKVSSSSTINSFNLLKSFHTSLKNPPISQRPLLSQKVASNKSINSDHTLPSSSSSTSLPHPVLSSYQHLLPHYDIKTHTRFIDWKSLYYNRFKIAKNWKLGQYQPYRFRSNPATLQQSSTDYMMEDNHHHHYLSSSMSTSSISSSNTNLNNHITSSSSTTITIPTTTNNHDYRRNNNNSNNANNHVGGISSFLPLSTTAPSLSQEELDLQEQRRLQQERDQHQDFVYSIYLDTSHHTVYSASRDKTIKEWYFHNSKAILQHTFKDLHQKSIYCLYVNDRYIVSGSGDHTVVQLDRWSRKKIRTLRGHLDSVLNVLMDTKRIFSASKDKTIKIWSSATGQLLKTLNGHTVAVNAIKVHGDRLVSASGDHTVKLWDINTGECLHTFEDHERGVSCIDFDGKFIVSGSNDRNIIIWDIHGNLIRKFNAHNGLVRTLQLQQQHQIKNTPRVIVSAGYNDAINVWDFNTGELLHVFPRYYEGRLINLRFDSMKVVVGLESGDIVIYDFAFGLDASFLL